MAKHKTAKELMAERNPLARTAVAPVDIYSQAPKPAGKPEAQKPTTATSEAKPVQVQSSEASIRKNTSDRERPYSTYLYQSQVKGIKLRAIDRELDDKDVMQEAIDEYLKNHPLS